MRINSRVEVIHFPSAPDSKTGYYLEVEVAVGGHRAWPFDVWAGDWKEMSEPEQHAYLERCAMGLLNRYGDAREIRIREDGQIVPRFGEAESAL